MNFREEFIMFMVRAGVLTFGEFQTKSGRKSPYFINTGNYQTGEQIARLGQFYADCIMEQIRSGKIKDVKALFGPAYKGIPLSVAATMALFMKYKNNISYCFNRKEEKDHGEGGSLVGYRLQDGDNVLIIEDVITAGTAVRECLPILQKAASVNVAGLVISVDRMERGQSDKTAIQEIEEEFGISTYPIVTVKDIIETLHNKKVDGKVVLDDEQREKMERYLDEYCVK